MAEVLDKFVQNQRRYVQLSISDYPDKLIPIPLFGIAVGLVTFSTITFPWLALLTVPASLLIVMGIFTGDVNLVDAPLEEE
jgi:hypothetical protein